MGPFVVILLGGLVLSIALPVTAIVLTRKLIRRYLPTTLDTR